MRCEITNKVIYETKNLAYQAGLLHCKRNTWSGNPPTTYFCNNCLGWHVTSKKKPQVLKAVTLKIPTNSSNQIAKWYRRVEAKKHFN